MAALSFAAAVIHLVMVPAHVGESLGLGLGFAVAGWFQLGFGVAVIVSANRAWLRVGIVANALFVGVWGLSRTAGLPFGMEGGAPEPAAFADLTCAGLELALVVACAVLLARPTLGAEVHRRAFVAAAMVPLGLVVLTTAALAVPSGHGHGAGHGDGHGDELALSAGAGGTGHPHSGTGAHDDHATDDHAAHAAAGETDHHGGEHRESAPAEGHDHAHAGSAVAAAAWSIGATEAEVADAETFIAETHAAVATFTSIEDAESKGYVRINADHLLSPQLLLDNKLLDPTAIESLIVAQRDGVDYIAGGMYLMNLGQTMKNVPRLGGPLLTWHSHGGFCFDRSVKIVGVDPATGACPPDATWFDDPPMTHIWSHPQSNADGAVRTEEACGVFVYVDLPHDRGVPGCSDEAGGGQAHA